MKNHWVWLILLGLVGGVCAKEEIQPNAKLPKHIKLVSGQMILVADYANRGGGSSIPVYLINDTKNPIKLTSQDGDVYLKLEMKDVDGKWHRAQPHAYSW